MKIVYTIALLFLITLSANSQKMFDKKKCLDHPWEFSSDSEKPQLYRTVSRNDEVAILKLDSTIKNGRVRDEYIYDENGYNTSCVTYNIYSCRNYKKYEYVYDFAGNKVLSTYFVWVDSTEIWLNHDKTEYTYDSKSNVTSKTEYTWDNMGAPITEWKTLTKDEYTYDENGNIILSINYSWSSDTNTWKSHNKEENIYDNEKNLLLNTVFYIWSSYSNAFEKYGEDQYVYNDDGTLKLYTSLSNEITQMRYVYNPNGTCQKIQNYSWNGTTNTWLYKNLQTYTYDSNGNLIAYILSSICCSDILLKELTQDITYDTNYTWNQVLPFVGKVSGFNNIVMTQNLWRNTSDWMYRYENYTYYYSFITDSAVDSVRKNNINVWVQNGYIMVDTSLLPNSQIQVYDILGRIIVNTNFTNNGVEQISVPKAGIYFLHIGVETVKVVVP